MYCGACMRDNRLAARLIQQGRDVLLIPLYMPIRTDEVDVSESRVYYGGLNVGLQQKSAFFRRIPKSLDRWLDSPTLLRLLGRLAAGIRPRDLGRLTVSVLAGEDGAQHKELTELVDALCALSPELVNLPNLMFVGVARALKSALNIPVLCTLAGEDFFLDTLPEPYRSQAFELISRGIQHVDGFIAPSRYYASHAVGHFGLDQERVHHVPMGIRIDDIGHPAAPPLAPFTIGYLAAVCPEKGLAGLCEAFALLRERGRDCRLRIAGYLSPGRRPYWAKIHRQLRQQGLGGVVDFLGEVNRTEKLHFLRSLHILSVPTVHPEPKGIFALEAMACGVPVVQPRHGSFPEMIEATGGGQLYDPTGPESLAETIAELMDNEPLRRQLAQDGRAVVCENFTDEVMATRTWSLYQRYWEGVHA